MAGFEHEQSIRHRTIGFRVSFLSSVCLLPSLAQVRPDHWSRMHRSWKADNKHIRTVHTGVWQANWLKFSQLSRLFASVSLPRVLSRFFLLVLFDHLLLLCSMTLSSCQYGGKAELSEGAQGRREAQINKSSSYDHQAKVFQSNERINDLRKVSCHSWTCSLSRSGKIIFSSRRTRPKNRNNFQC